MSDDSVSSTKQTEPSSNITIGDIVNSEAIAIGPGARAEVHKHYASPPPLSPEEAARLLAEYRARLLEETRYVNLRGIPLPRGRDGRPMPLQVPLDKVYIRIQATTEKQRRAQEEAEERSLLDRLRGGGKSEPSPRDVLSTLHTLGEYLYRRGEVYEAEKRPEPVDPQEALKKHKRLVVLGAPGAGKSTLLRYLARRAVEDSSGFVPIQVSLRDYATALAGDNTLALSEFALRVASAGYSALRQALEDEINNGHILWLVDALDEARGWATNAARQAGQLPGQLILTSRPIGYVSTGLESLPHFEVLPLTSENIDEFLLNWFGLLAVQRAADGEWTAARVAWLKKQLEAHPRIRTLTRNPLLLTFLVVLAGEDPLHDLPDHRAELYRRYVEELLGSWETARLPKDGAEGRPVFTLGPLQGEQARQVALQGFYYLGWALHLAYYGGKPQEPPTRNALTRTLVDYFQADGAKDAKASAMSILDFWQEAGLLETWYLDGDEYLSFRHLTFQEYAAAWGIAEAWKRDPKHAWKFLRPRLHHYAWHEPLLLLTGLLSPNHLNKLVRCLLRGQSNYESSLHRDLRLAGELLAEGAALDSKHRILRKLGWLGQSHFVLRLSMGFLPYVFGSLLILLALQVELLTSCVGVLVFGIVFMLLVTKIPAFTRIAFYPTRIWKYSADPATVLFLFARIGYDSVYYLVRALKDRMPSVSSSAVEALSHIGDPRITPYLIQQLQSNSVVKSVENWVVGRNRVGFIREGFILLFSWIVGDIYVREPAAEALGRLGDVRAVPPLIEAMQSRNNFVLSTIPEALGRLGDVRAVPPLIKALQDREEWVCVASAEALGRLGDVRAVPPLIEALQDRDEYYMLRRVAAVALGQLGDVRAVPPLIEALQDKEERVRAAAAKVLGQIGDVRAVPHLIRALQDKDEDVRRKAIEALGQIRDVQIIPFLVKALHEKDESKRVTAAAALGQIGDVRSVPPLIEALQSRNGWVRATAATALGQVGDERAVLTLIEDLQDSNEDIRRTAIKALGQMGDVRAVPPLIETLQSNNDWARADTAEALGQIGDARAVPPLIETLHSKNDWARAAAAKALGQIGDARAVLPLTRILLDRYEWVRDYVAEALGRCSNNLDDIKIVRQVSRALYGLLTDLQMADVAFSSFEQIANRLSVLEVEAMPLVDPLLPDLKRTKKH